MKKIQALLRVLPAVVVLLGPARAVPEKIAAVEGITEYRLANGLRVLLYPDSSQAKVVVNMTVLVGSRQEGYGETGMAHLLEHMLFKGTPRHPNIPKALQDHGARFNGSTSADRVNYHETLVANDANLEFALDLEADRLMNSLIRKEDLASEMTVVRNEFERGENSPQGVLMQRIEQVAYDWHNYGKPTIGNRSDIERVPVENLRAFYRKYYQPDNVVLIVAGRLETDKTLGLVEKYFGSIPRPARQLDTTWTEEPPQDGERTVVLRRVGDAGSIGVAYHIPAAAHADTAALEVLANILSDEPSGRLYQALVVTKKVASASAYAHGEHDPGLMIVEAEMNREGSIEAARDLLLATVEQIGAGGVTTQEVNRARRQILKQRELIATDSSHMGLALSEWVAQGDWRLFFLDRDRIEQVTPAAVQAVAARYLRRNNRTVGLFIPSAQAERVAIPAAPALPALVAHYQGRAPIAEGESFEASPANIEARARRMAWPEGIKVTLLPKKTRGEEVRLLLTLRFGNEDNLKGMATAAGILPDWMLRGTRHLSYQELNDELDRLKATLTASSSGEGGGLPGAISFTIQARRATLPAVLDLLRQVLREPALPADQFDVIKRERLAELERLRTEPGLLAPRLLQRLLNPQAADDVRYVPTVDESIERLRAATGEQATRLYRDYLGSQAGELALVGDFDADACLPVLKAALGGWRAAQPYARIALPLAGATTGSRHEINTPDKANATYMAGELLPLRDDDPDYPLLVMGNYILGGGTLTSRLGVRVRQKEGLSYGIVSSLDASSFDPRAAWTIRAICNPRNIGRVELAVRDELERLLRDGLTAAELDQAKQGYLQAQKVARASDASLVGLLATFSHADRTLAWQADFEQKIAALTVAQVNAALRKFIDPKKLIIVTAGDFTPAAPR